MRLNNFAYRPWTVPVRIDLENDVLVVRSPYSATFVDSLKVTIPNHGREWDKFGKVWKVSPSFGVKLKEIVDRAYGSDVVLPALPTDVSDGEFEGEFRAEYIANCRNGFASVWSGDKCVGSVSEFALREWFRQPADAPATLYGALGVDQGASSLEIKSAFKRMARVWHPDICREPNAREMFEKIREAYGILSDDQSRRKYDAALAFERLAAPRQVTVPVSFTTPIKCGLLIVKGRRELGKITATKIIDWREIRNECGQVMTAYWEQGAKAIWV